MSIAFQDLVHGAVPAVKRGLSCIVTFQSTVDGSTFREK